LARHPFVVLSENIWRITTASIIIRGWEIGCLNQLTVAVSPLNQFSVVNSTEVFSIITIVQQLEGEYSVFATHAVTE